MVQYVKRAPRGGQRPWPVPLRRADLAAAGVWIDPERMNESYGRFAWIKDCDGNRVELWQPLGE